MAGPSPDPATGSAPDPAAALAPATAGHEAVASGSKVSDKPATAEQPPMPSGPNVQEQAALAAAERDEGAVGSEDGDELSVSSRASTSLRSSLLDHHYDQGRRYHRYRHGRYVLPNDDVEQDREHMMHVLHLETSDGKLFNAPIGDNPQRILDLCTGTGLWAIDVADQYSSAEVTGIDLSPIQSSWVPPNLRFLIDDVEDEWVDEEPYNFIHMRHTAKYLKDIDGLLKNCYNHLQPGGWVEFSSFEGYPRCDDGTMPDDFPLIQFVVRLDQAMAKKGMNTRVVYEHEKQFKEAGFRNVQCNITKMPIGAWPKDKTQRLIGGYYRETLMGWVNAMASGSKPIKSADMSDAELEVFMMSVRKSMVDLKVHSYFAFISWWGQK